MDINFPLILVLLVFVSGFIWLFDALFLAARRKAAIAAVDTQFAGLEVDSENQQDAYLQAKTQAAKEPLAVEYSKSFFPVLFVVLVLRSFLVEPFQIPSGSMVPTLEIGDFILVNKYTYGVRLPVVRNKIIPVNDPKRGDVMVFFPPHRPDTYFIKRVVGLPGDEILYINNVLYINGEKQPQTLLASLPPGNPQFQLMKETLAGVEHDMRKHVVPGRLSREGSWVVPEGHYFMMGDNRDNSSDSREWGPVPEEAIVGKAFAVWMHWDSFFSLPSFSRLGPIR
ncbi:MAG: signal peptidase I [Gammaproteobacteria bacterium]|uniref:signal peptidase I n=1 Tax=Pseudomaricurvus alcaniphilus TaxID=1166482 RepID=UPI00140C528F|nr:signal peptidase I [Pseudomaricurvus alcaniphilus]MBR9911690.1 signal peptidase I [Gammaproteobacteria bacterium]NHN39365.1 signal peptidase I [Pseudomaricurvus alcaniphilus]